MTEPVKLGVVPIVPGAPNERIIELVREVLRDAKSGKIQAVSMAVSLINPDGDGGRCTETVISHSEGWAHTNSAAVSGLWMRLHYERYAKGNVLPEPKLSDEDE